MVGFVGRDGCVSARREGRRGNSYVGISARDPAIPQTTAELLRGDVLQWLAGPHG